MRFIISTKLNPIFDAWIKSKGFRFFPILLFEYLTTTKIGEKGQLTVPKQFREDLGLGNGAPFAVLRLGDGLILLPEQQRFEPLCEQVSTRLSRAGLTSDDLRATLPAARDRVYARRYGTKSSTSAARRRSRTHRKK